MLGLRVSVTRARLEPQAASVRAVFATELDVPQIRMGIGQDHTVSAMGVHKAAQEIDAARAALVTIVRAKQ